MGFEPSRGDGLAARRFVAAHLKDFCFFLFVLLICYHVLITKRLDDKTKESGATMQHNIFGSDRMIKLICNGACVFPLPASLLDLIRVLVAKLVNSATVSKRDQCNICEQ